MSNSPLQSVPRASDETVIAIAQLQTAEGNPLAALCMLARLHHIVAEPHGVQHKLGLGASEEVTPQHLLLAAKSLGLKAKLTRSSSDRLALCPLPALARQLDGSWVLLAQCDANRVLLFDATRGVDTRPTIEPRSLFEQRWSGELLLATSHASLAGELAKFDFTWFIPSLVKHRRLIGEVLLISLFLQLFALASPLFFQVIMDKVLIHKGVSTLDVLCIGLVVVVCFESLLNVVRSYIFSHTTNRIDVELGSRLFRHLLDLPLSYFQSRRVGDSVARVRELENIRQFITGNALTLVLDLVFSALFIAIMLSYSVKLTLIVLISLPLYAILSLAIVPLLRSRLNEKFARGAENQALLVETISGIQTVKAGALEPQIARRWDRQLAAYVTASYRTQQLATQGNEGISLIGKLINAATLWVGANAAMNGEMTVGMFVAFNMFASKVSQPVMRIAQMWTDFQQTGISLARLGDILNTRAEISPQGSGLPSKVRGEVTFENVRFRYRPDTQPVLRGISLQIASGEIVGIVGRSGSGKSTLTKLIQRLYSPESGRVLIDGHDLALLDAAQLRRQIGVVLQENLLFNRSVRENIAIQDPAAPLESVVNAAKLAGAHEFITTLSDGYDTIVSEQGASLSGGQRQRIAIARALFSEPRILIFDEATSALDYESEAIIQQNMHSICSGRTVFIIAHRLTAVRNADRIVTMEHGEIAESGSHAQLVAMKGGIYAQLWKLQSDGRPSKE
jgi:subfamily B ATP-binding cassette protein HlyB/CyaB